MALAEKYVIMFQKEFEQASMLLVKTFNRVEDVTEKSKEVEFFIDIFTKIIKH